MSKKLLANDVAAMLRTGIIVPLTAKQWSKMAEGFGFVEAVETFMAGQILLVRVPGPRQGWAVVEQPAEGKRVIRPLKNEKEARALIQDRLAAYERMWDG